PRAPCRPTYARGEPRRACPDARSSSRRRPAPLSPPSHGLLLAGVIAERTGRRELAKLVTDHGLGDVHRHVLASVVHRAGVTDHVGDDRGTTAPGLDDLLRALGVQLVDL